jgi:hypothetical protein
MMRAHGCGGAVLVAWLGACSPTAESSGTETETETESSSGTASADATAASATTMGTSTTTTATSATTNPTTAETTSPETTVAEEGPLEVGEETVGCPPGSEGCLCDVGSTCDEGLECVRGTCMPSDPCERPEGEPNDVEADAVPLDPADCGAEAQAIDGALADMDIDWFAFDITGGFPFCVTDPAATVVADAELEVCIYAACDMGMPNAGCGFGGGQMDAMSPDGLPGCCGPGGAELTDSGCNFDGLADSVVVSVAGGRGGVCLPYTLSWSF